MVDMHCDETDDPLSRHIETLACETQRLGLQGRVAGSHLTSMHSMDNYYVSKLMPLIAEAGVSRDPQSADQHHAAGPPRHLSQAPRHDARAGDDGGRHPRRLRPGLRARPVVFAGHGRHARRRPHGPARRADDRARPTCARCFDMVTNVNAAIMGLDHLGLAVRQDAPASSCSTPAIRSRRCGCAPSGSASSRGARWWRSARSSETRLSIAGRPGQP